MTPEEREQKIQEALKNAEAAWDEKYTQEEWTTLNAEETEKRKGSATPKDPKARRVGKGYASKALKNLY